MATPLLSVCLPILNARGFLEPRMESLLAQTNRDWELVVGDSHSDDGSWEFLQKFKGDPRVRLYQIPRAGLYAGWNECLSRCAGQYIHIAPGDDFEAPAFQETLINSLDSHPDCALAYCRHQDVDELGRPLPECPPSLRECYETLLGRPVRRFSAKEAFHAISLWAPWFTLNALIFRRTLLEKTGPFPTNLGRHGDTAWAWRAALGSDTLFHPEVLAYWRRHAEQATDSGVTKRKVALEMRQVIEQSLAFLDANASRLPPAWKQVPGWRERLLALRYHEVRDAGMLTRQTLRQHPADFLDAALWAMRHDRPFLARQIRSGFGYREVQDHFDCRAFLRQAERDFALPDQQPLAG